MAATIPPLVISTSSTVSVILFSLILLTSCRDDEKEYTRGDIYVQEDPVNQVTTITFKNGEIIERSSHPLPDSVFHDEVFDPKPSEPPIAPILPDKIHPHLRELIGTQPADHRVRVVITFEDDLTIPRFPDLFPDEPRDSPANQLVLAYADSLAESISEQRAGSYDTLQAELESVFDAQDVDRFWLINGVAAEVPLGAVPDLEGRPDVAYVQADTSGEGPPQGPGIPTVADGRRLTGTDPYYQLGLTGGYIGLLDTGIRTSHELLSGPLVDYLFDCSDGVCDDQPDPAGDLSDHGTSSAAIISGNDSMGPAYRGVTGVTLDSYKVYFLDAYGDPEISAIAAVKAMQKAVVVLDRVIVAEMQLDETDAGAVSTASDDAFDAGAAIVAANGNNGWHNGQYRAWSVNGPAIAHKVLGVGAYHADDPALDTAIGQSLGPATDSRIKPDLQGPTGTETASSALDDGLRRHGATSGATPYVGGAAALIRNWLRGNNPSIDPGQVYAELILAGSEVYPFNNTKGAGRLLLADNRTSWWGKTVVSDGMTVAIPLSVPATASISSLDAALWWPESRTQSHSDLDLVLVDPNGGERDVSQDVPGVFERVSVPAAAPLGTWTLKVRGYSIPKGSQVVYWAAQAVY